MPCVHVEADEFIDEIDTETLVAELIKRKDWKQTLEKALKKDEAFVTPTAMIEVARVVEAFKYGRPVDELLRRLAWEIGVFA